MAYPSGRQVSFTRDAQGQVTQVSTCENSSGTWSPVLQTNQWQPYGPFSGASLDLHELAQQLDDRQQDFPTTPVIVDGICLREVLDRIGRNFEWTE
jgi:hypothetical protein